MHQEIHYDSFIAGYIEEHKIDAAMGGARRMKKKLELKSVFSHRDEFGQWDPKNQRPELWNLFNGRKHIWRAL